MHGSSVIGAETNDTLPMMLLATRGSHINSCVCRRRRDPRLNNMRLWREQLLVHASNTSSSSSTTGTRGRHGDGDGLSLGISLLFKLSNDRGCFGLCDSLNQLLSLRIRRARVINEDILGVSRRLPKQVEDGNPVSGVSLGERVPGYPDLADIRDGSQPGQFDGVRDGVVTQVQAFEREQAFNTGYRAKSVATEIQRGYGWQGAAGERVQRIYHAVG